jgi:hypothetical protein
MVGKNMFVTPQLCEGLLTAVRGSPDPAHAPTVGLRVSLGDLRSSLAAGSGDYRRKHVSASEMTAPGRVMTLQRTARDVS